MNSTSNTMHTFRSIGGGKYLTISVIDQYNKIIFNSDAPCIDTIEQLVEHLNNLCEEFDAQSIEKEMKLKAIQEQEEKAQEKLDADKAAQVKALDRHLTEYLQQLREKVTIAFLSQ